MGRVPVAIEMRTPDADLTNRPELAIGFLLYIVATVIEIRAGYLGSHTCTPQCLGQNPAHLFAIAI